ncbi:2-oxoglutarate ferredoxin oxidoreductase subunit alpha [Caldalkalibacillus uzonensis]|uniref:2-oxoglutarate ferredoxin oxidoreductase subunit alpha n=1 Tax=Caldalkalibacillus uzonensis TaxID=353224 RepID=A0ABU0CWU5_9BACI|nr:2-oxoacid:acceptor oxidoreductase family protein [Caldalkalibacillus uzonensis]MDQ0339960.1 2-oxoglutarate ferredoxin oxidoreductase subunit alpha [Caldalkalibacillus uzonensis]
MKSIAISGLTGQGIETAGEILSSVVNSLGYRHRTWRDFSTIIRGGHTSFEIYIADKEEGLLPTRVKHLNLAVVWNDEGVQHYQHRVKEKNRMFGSSKAKGILPENQVDVPNLGFNVWSLGLIAAYLGIPLELLKSEVSTRFKGKSNEELLVQGFQLGKTIETDQPLVPLDSENVILSGNDALCLGAIAGGVRHYYGYPITPASEILENFFRWLPPLGGAAYQLEDEIAAIHAAIGCSYAGERTFVATSGPGLALMTEGLSYTAATEIPLVIVDNQRGGPSTGMPTKTEQSDLMHLRHAGHGDFARILLTPTNIIDCIITMQEALNLADYYQCPVLLALDLDLAVRKVSIPWSAVERALQSIQLNRGPTITDLNTSLEGYVRYRPPAEGVPPLRSIPGVAGGAYVASGDEHDERGWMEPDFGEVRQTLHKRRTFKADHIEYDRPFTTLGDPKAPVMIIGTGALGELIETLVGDRSADFQGLLIRQLSPVPCEALTEALAHVEQVIIAEYNATGQIRTILSEVLSDKQVLSLLRFDGEHYTLEEFSESIDRLLKEVEVKNK